MQGKINLGVPVRIVLEKGAVFQGIGYGISDKPRSAEFVFCTSMTGIEESLTDPSFAKQALVSTVSHVGNTGFTNQDQESRKIWTEGLVCRHLSYNPSSWRSEKTLLDWILSQDAFVVEGVNTRAFATFLRDNGSQRGLVVEESQFQSVGIERMLTRVTDAPSMQGLDLTSYVSCSDPYEFSKSGKKKIIVYDFGVKTQTLKILTHLDYSVQVVPASTKAKDVLALKPWAVLLSNGPGDPSAATYLHREIRELINRVPLFAICLGHQLMAHALGGKTYKMKYGHRGIHHPVNELDLENGAVVRTWITSQNHGFAVDVDSIGNEAKVWFVHSDDESVEGFAIPNKNIWSVQFHPEAAPGPTEAGELLKKFSQRGIDP
jgi:carbamoyl-phosphate synthase small subunit